MNLSFSSLQKTNSRSDKAFADKRAIWDEEVCDDRNIWEEDVWDNKEI